MNRPERARPANCAGCMFSNPELRNGAMVVECRRYPPQLGLLDDGKMAAQAWPQMEATDWCGEYEPDDDRTTP